MIYDDLTPVLVLRDDRARRGDTKGVELAQALAEHMWELMRPIESAQIEPAVKLHGFKATSAEAEAVLHASGATQVETPPKDDPDNPFDGLS